MHRAYIVLCVALIVLAFCAGELHSKGWWIDQYSGDTTQEQVLQIMYQARGSHQYYIDNPELADRRTNGSLQHHIDCVARYDRVIHWVKEH